MLALRWFNPRTGEFVGDIISLDGGEWADLGYTPDGFQNVNDWVALVTAVPEPAASLMFAPNGLLLVCRRRH